VAPSIAALPASVSDAIRARPRAAGATSIHPCLSSGAIARYSEVRSITSASASRLSGISPPRAMCRSTENCAIVIPVPLSASS
jgi:hypothetical protein